MKKWLAMLLSIVLTVQLAVPAWAADGGAEQPETVPGGYTETDPAETPTPEPAADPTAEPTAEPTPEPTAVPVEDPAAEDEPALLTATVVASGTCGDDLRWALYEDGILSITGTGPMYDFSASGSDTAPWYSYDDEIKTVDIEDGVTSIGRWAFDGCTSLKDVYYTSCSEAGWKNITIGSYNDPLQNATVHYLEHQWNEGKVTTPATCTENGVKTYTCSVCKEIKTEAVEKLGHAFGAVEVIKAPTCTETGISGKRCTHEGCEVIDSETVLAATGHTWDEGMVTTEPTYETDGIKTFTCSVCKATKTEQIPALAPTVVASGKCGHSDNVGGESSVTWSLSEEGVLTISGTGAMDNYLLETDTPWYKYNNKIKSIVIENGVTSVGNYAFRFCTTATAVTIANSVEKIGDYAFENGYNIVDLTLSNKLTSVGKEAFSSCSKITSLDLPETLTTTGHYAFSGCKALTSLTIPSSLKTIDGYAFAGCSGLTEVTISDGVKSIQAGAFQTCTALAGVHIPYGLTSVGKSAFSDCTSLKNIYYGGTWEDWRKVSIDSGNDPLKAAFCHPTDEFECGDNLMWSLSEDGVLTISGTGAMDNYLLETDTPWYKYNNKIKSIVIENGVTSVGNYAFRFCTTATAVTIANSVEKIGDYAFENGYNIVDLTLSNKLTSVGKEAFSSCSKITSLDLPETLTTTGHYAFSGCKALTSLTIPSSLKTIDGYAFAGCSGLTEVTISDGVKSIQAGAFQTCTALAGVHIPYGLTSVGKSAFSDCTSLKNIYYGGTWEDWRKVSIDSGNDPLKAAFCHPTDEFECGDNLMWSLSEEGVLTISGTGAMDDYTNETETPWYKYNNKIKTVILKTGVTSIGSKAFSNCSNLTNIDIPLSVTTIGDSSFSYCTALENVFYAGCSESVWEKIAIESNNKPLLNAARQYSAHTWGEGMVTTEPTCTEDGVKTYTCSVCNETKTETITATGHQWDEGKVTTPATCTENGVKTYTCSVCKEIKTEAVEKLGHAFGAVEVIKAPTCTETGISGKRCQHEGCDVIDSETVLPATGHQWDGGEITTPATCTENGVKTYTCSVCKEIKTEAVEKLGHAFGAVEVIKAPTCTETGISGKRCQHEGCDVIDSETVLPATGHQWDGGEITTPATCTENGVKTYTCSVCSETKNETVEKLGHAFGAVEVIKAPTCTETGISGKRCTHDGCEVIDSETVIPATGHQWDEGVVTREPTYTEDGEKTFTCAICRTIRTETIPALTPEPDSVDLNEIARDFDGSSIGVDVDGKTVYPDGEGNYPRLTVPEGTTTLISVSTCNLPEGVDPHTRYPVSMAVYKATNTDGTTSVERISEMDDLLRYAGSSIRITGNKGIRLITGINASLKSALTSEGVAGYTLEEYGTLLCWASEVQNGSLSLSDAYARHNYAYSLANGTDPVFRYAGDVVQYTNVLVGFTNEQCVDDIAMRPYITLRDADGNTYTLYGGIVNRSIGYIAYQNRGAFAPGTNAYNYIWDIIHFVYGDAYDEDYKG